MTVIEFEDFLINTKVQLLDAFQKSENISDLDVYIKTVLDYQEIIAKGLFKELNEIKLEIANCRGDILKDNRERFTEVMKKLNEKENE